MSSYQQDKLYRQLQAALAKTNASDLKEWGSKSAARLPKIAARRVKNLGALLSALAKFTGKELSAAIRALREGRFGTHFEDRAANAIDGTIDLSKRITLATTAIGKALFDDPKKNAPGVLALALGFLGGSGGLDANGGVPDTDIVLGGIGSHRSIFTHSIVAGILVEGAIYAVADLADVVCEKLPASERDPFWDRLVEAKNTIAQQLAVGASAGIAYHLGVDATLQPGAYHGLPGSMPMEAHQTLLAMNAVTEGLDSAHKDETTGRKVVSGIKTAGSAVVKSAVAGAESVWTFAKTQMTGKL